MALKKSLMQKMRRVTTKAAIAASKFKGLNDKIGADKAAVDVMRNELNSIDMNGRVVIGEGEMDEAPMLFIGEKLGTKKGLEIDIAVDPVEGTNFVAKNLSGGISVLAIAEKIIKPIKNASTYPDILLAITLPTAAGLAAKDVKRINVVETGILNLVRISKKIGAAICKK